MFTFFSVFNKTIEKQQQQRAWELLILSQACESVLRTILDIGGSF